MALASTILRTIAPRRIVIATLLMTGSRRCRTRRGAPTTLLNASYDVSRELYKDINAAFIADWKKKTGEEIVINQSHGGSTKQALAVANGLEADVVTFNQAPDVDVLVKQGGLVVGRLAQEVPQRRRAIHDDLRFPRPQGQPEGHQELG